MNDQPRIPRYVRLAAAVLAAVVGLTVMVWVVLDMRGAACERAVTNREDGRAVWLYLVARDPDRRDDPDVIEFVRFLNDRLPPLICINRKPTPVAP